MEKTSVQKERGAVGAFGAVGGFVIAVILLLAVCTAVFCIGRLMTKPSSPVSGVADTAARHWVIVVDAGHGGMDSGAVGADGTLEKNINLTVAKRLSQLLRLAGIECTMSRTKDEMLVEEGVKSHRKMHDLKNRLAVVNKAAESGREAVLVSIHMNNFSSGEYSGLQVWYSANDSGSAHLASFIQGYARTWLAPENTREIKKATSAIYLLDRASFPAVLVECGFLSNAAECAKLNTTEYQTELAVTIFAALCEWMDNAEK